MSFSPSFAQVNPGLTGSPPSTAAGVGNPLIIVNPAVEGAWTTWTQQYNAKTTIGAGTILACIVHNDGTAIIIDSAKEVNFINAAGTASDSGVAAKSTTFPVANLGLNYSTSDAYLITGNNVAATFFIFKDNALAQTITPTLASVGAFAMSPNGQYILLCNSAGNTFELWKGA